VRSPFGSEEGVILVAIERANGGELAPISQVLWTLHSFTAQGSRPDPAGFAASAALLIQLGVVDYLDGQLGLTPEGRKLLRRSGMPNDRRHVALVTEQLQEFDELDLESDEPLLAPTEADVQNAIDEEQVQVDDGGQIEQAARDPGVPVVGADIPGYSPILGLGSPGLVRSPPWVPSVPPKDSGESPEPIQAAPLQVSPAHPLIDRLLGRGRRNRGVPDS
jgi:hypothetical protein